MTQPFSPSPSRRNHRAAIVAQAPDAALRQAWATYPDDPAFTYVRRPETGLVCVRGRIGGGGASFPFGDATATRTTVRLENGAIGHAMVLGRNAERATIAAVIDALARDPNAATGIDKHIIEPLAQALAARDAKRARQTAATKVDFFTLVRGED